MWTAIWGVGHCLEVYMVENGAQEGEVVLTRPLRRARCVRGACVVGCTERGASASAVGAIWGGGGWGRVWLGSGDDTRGGDQEEDEEEEGEDREEEDWEHDGGCVRERGLWGAQGAHRPTRCHVCARLFPLRVTNKSEPPKPRSGHAKSQAPGWPMDHRTTTTVAVPGWHPLYKPPSPTVPFGVWVT